MNELEKIAMVTGAGSGIGAAIAQSLADQNFHVVAAGRRGDAFRETASTVPGSMSVHPLDVGDRSAVDEIVDSVV